MPFLINFVFLFFLKFVHVVDQGYAFEVPSGATYILRGTRESPISFSGIPDSYKSNFKHLELTYVNFEPDGLIQSLQGCDNLESIILGRLENFQWKFGQRVNLPNLKSFLIDVPWIDGKVNESTIKSIIFFDKNNTVSKWKFEHIYKLNTDITISQYSRYELNDENHSNLFVINHAPGILEAKLDFTDLLLQNLKGNFNLKKLAVSAPWDSSLVIDPNSMQETVTHLEFHGAQVLTGNVSTLLKIPTALQQLSLYRINENFDLATLPTKSLRKLSIGSSDGATVTRIVPFEKLTTLEYFFTPVPAFLIKNYDKMFPWVKFVFFRLNNGNDGEQSLLFLRNILKTCTQRISLFDFSWGELHKCRDSTLTYRNVDNGVIKFLLDAGVSPCSSSFRLTKDKATGVWNNTEYSEEWDASFAAGIRVPDTLQGEGSLEDCGRILSIGPVEEPEKETSPPSPILVPNDDIKPSNTPICSSEGFFPDAANCSRYYRCAQEIFLRENGEPKFSKHDFECGPGTSFDVKLLLCNHSEQAQTVATCKPKEDLNNVLE